MECSREGSMEYWMVVFEIRSHHQSKRYREIAMFSNTVEVSINPSRYLRWLDYVHLQGEICQYRYITPPSVLQVHNFIIVHSIRDYKSTTSLSVHNVRD